MSKAPSSNGAATPAGPRVGQAPQQGWVLLIYRVPPEPSNNRVTVWRNLKRMGGLYLQQCVCIVPAFPACVARVQTIAQRITAYGGSYNSFRVRELEPQEETALLDSFRELSRKEYAEILEECRTKFAKEIEFERFRENYTYEEAEEIREDLNKIRRWHERVVERDWFDAGMREQVEEELKTCHRLLVAFEADVYRRIGEDQDLGHSAPGTEPDSARLTVGAGAGDGDGEDVNDRPPARANVTGGERPASGGARKRGGR